MCGWGVSWERFFKVISVEMRLLSLFAQFTDHISTVRTSTLAALLEPLPSTTAAHIPLQALIHRKPEFVLEAGHLLKAHRREFIDTGHYS